MSEKSKFQLKVEEMLLKYINRFLRYAKFAHLSGPRREVIAGTFHYLLDEQDLVPDDVPNIGFLDDLLVFLKASESFVEEGQSIPGVVNAEELASDLEFMEKHKSLIYGNQSCSIEVIRKKGRQAGNLDELCAQIKEKYMNLGRLEE